MVWIRGIGRVVASRNKEVAVGERLYGLFPMHQYTVIRVSRISEGSLVDLSAHKKDLAVIYNTYNRLNSGTDVFYSPKWENQMLLLRPLFLTSWLLRDFAQEFLKDADKSRVFVTSASSKTSFMLAYLLKAIGISVVGLTSTKNIHYVKKLSVYSSVLAYSEVPSIPQTSGQSMLIDMAGDGTLLRKVLSQLEPSAKCILVGATDWEKGMKDLPGEFFFAPHYAKNAIKRVGEANFNKQVSSDWFKILGEIESNHWLRVSENFGPGALEFTYKSYLEPGGVNPDTGMILSLWEPSNI